MKKFLLMILGVTALIAAGGCQKEKTVTTPQSVSVRTQSGGAMDAAAGTRAVTIDATADWTAASEADWITVSPESGKRGVNEVILTYSANTTSQDRVGIVRFTSGSYSETFSLKQSK